MNVESTELVWLTAKEVEQAIRAFVRTKGFQVTNHARVTGLEFSDAREVVNVRTSHSMSEVKA